MTMGKNSGIKASEDRGDRESGDFMDAIRQGIIIFAARKMPFQSFDVIQHVKELGIAPHDELRCIGGAFRAAANRELIKVYSIGAYKGSSRHSGHATWWIGT